MLCTLLEHMGVILGICSVKSETYHVACSSYIAQYPVR